jgi:hypothetical protein
MAMLIEVERPQAGQNVKVSAMKKEKWVFNFTSSFGELRLKLQEYKSLERQSKRHRYRIVQKWDMWSREKEKPRVPPDVLEDACQRLISSIRII